MTKQTNLKETFDKTYFINLIKYSPKAYHEYHTKIILITC